MGIAMMFFNWVIFVVSIFAMIMFHLQIVNVEEEFLLEAFGEEYLSYRQKVCRYIGRKSESYLNFMRRNNRMITYRRIEEEELCIKLFDRFIRHQVVTKCWRKEEGEWVIKDVPFIDDWRALPRWSRNYLVVRSSIWTFPAFMYPRICGAGESERRFLLRQRSGRKSMERASFISPAILRWRPRHFIRKWAAWRPSCTTKPMWKRNHVTASWNADYNVEKAEVKLQEFRLIREG